MSARAGLLQPLHPTVRRSPYFARTLEHGACNLMVYNGMYMPMAVSYTHLTLPTICSV